MPSPYRSRSSKQPKPRFKGPVKPVAVSTEEDRRHPTGREWDRKKANVISFYKGICGLCDHPGVAPNGQVDHKVVDYPLDNSLPNLRPAHGSSGRQKNPCPVCRLNCNQVRGGLSFEAGRAKIARRIEAQGITPPVNNVEQDTGREW